MLQILWNMKIENTASMVLSATVCHTTHNFAQETLFDKHWGEKCVSPGVSSLWRNEPGLSSETTWHWLSAINWLGRSIRLELVHMWLNNQNNWDNLTQSSNILRLIFADWANLTAVIAFNLHQLCWSTDQVVRSLQKTGYKMPVFPAFYLIIAVVRSGRQAKIAQRRLQNLIICTSGNLHW